MKIAMFAHFKDYHGNHKKFKSLYGLGDAVSKIRDGCMDFDPYFKVHNLVSVHPKNIKLGQMTNLNELRSFRHKSVLPQVVSPQLEVVSPVVSPQLEVVSLQLKVVSPRLKVSSPEVFSYDFESNKRLT